MTQPPRPPRTLMVVVLDSSGITVLGTWPDAGAAGGELRIRQGIGSSERLELALPRRLGLADIQNELYTGGSLALGNQLQVHLTDWRTRGGQQADITRLGSGATDLSRTLWSGTIRAIGQQPEGMTVTAVGAVGAADASPQAHTISAGALLGWNLELSDYRLPGTVDYTGTIEVSHELYDTTAIKLGDTITVLEQRVLNVDSGTRYNAYGDAPRTVHSLEWSWRGLSVTFSARAPDLTNDQLAKLTDTTRNATTATLSSTDQLVASGGLTTKTLALAPTDGSVGTPSDGTIILDSTNARLYVRSGGVWKYATLT